jgi:hypothetical protein
MTLFFPDLNVWIALSVDGHAHNAQAWNWFNSLPAGATLIFARYTQVGLIRLLTNESMMRSEALTLRKAWSVYDQWMDDPHVDFFPEPRGLDATFRQVTAPFANRAASQLVGDCYVLAFAMQSHATLVTFDKALHGLAGRHGCPALIPG